MFGATDWNAVRWCARAQEHPPLLRPSRCSEAGTVAWKNEIPATDKLPYEVIKTKADEAHPVPQNEPASANAVSETHDPARGRLRNLEAALVIHLHGPRVQSDSDRCPDDVAAPGQSAHYTSTRNTRLPSCFGTTITLCT